MVKNGRPNQAWWLRLVMPAFGRQRQRITVSLRGYSKNLEKEKKRKKIMATIFYE